MKILKTYTFSLFNKNTMRAQESLYVITFHLYNKAGACVHVENLAAGCSPRRRLQQFVLPADINKNHICSLFVGARAVGRRTNAELRGHQPFPCRNKIEDHVRSDFIFTKNSF